jgi:hypothetical protein
VLPGIERLADDQNSNLTPWAATQMRMHNELVKRGIALSLPNPGVGPAALPVNCCFFSPSISSRPRKRSG